MRWFCFLLVMIIASGCHRRELVPGFVKGPGLAVVSVVVVRQTAEGVSLAITIDASNGNVEAMPLIKAQYKVVLVGGESVNLEESVHRTLPGHGRQQFVLPAALPLGGDGGQGSVLGREYVVEGTVVYDPPGMVRRFMKETQVPPPTVSFYRRGVLEQGVLEQGVLEQ